MLLLFYFSYSIEHSNLSFQLCTFRLLANDKENLDWAAEYGWSARMRKLHDEVFCGFMLLSIYAYYCFSEMLVKYKCAKLHGVTSQSTVHRIFINVKIEFLILDIPVEGFWDMMLCNW
jgi:hypothetical protein